MKNFGLSTFNNFFDDLDNVLNSNVFGIFPFGNFTDKAAYSNMNVEESDTEYTLSIPVPGLDKSDIKVQINNGYVEVSYKKEVKEDDKKHLRKSWSVESFDEEYAIPENVKVDDIDAKVENGVLTVSLPKDKELPKKNEPKTIELK